MKISVLTATYNREKLIINLYNSLKENAKYNVEIEWLIMDDGSNDDTEKLIKEFKKENKVEIKYYYQENQGKMAAINKLVGQATGDFIIDCDSDDYFTNDAFMIINEVYEKNKNNLDDIYALCFFKQYKNGENIGKKFKKDKTTMFDLYFKEGEDGEKVLVFFSKIRKQYKHELENDEKFITEARMYHKIDKDFKIFCVNKPIMVCEYQENGYTKNISNQFKKNPYGYYEYFKEILEKDMNGVTFKKRLYVIKHYILFSYLTKQYTGKNIRNFKNKILYYTFLIPGLLKSKLNYGHSLQKHLT